MNEGLRVLDRPSFHQIRPKLAGEIEPGVHLRDSESLLPKAKSGKNVNLAGKVPITPLPRILTTTCRFVVLPGPNLLHFLPYNRPSLNIVIIFLRTFARKDQAIIL